MSFCVLGKPYKVPQGKRNAGASHLNLILCQPRTVGWKNPKRFIGQLPHHEHRDYHLSHVRVSISSWPLVFSFCVPQKNSCLFKVPFLRWSHQFRQPCEFPAKACWFHWRHRPLWLSILQYLYCWGGMNKLDDSGRTFPTRQGFPEKLGNSSPKWWKDQGNPPRKCPKLSGSCSDDWTHKSDRLRILRVVVAQEKKWKSSNELKELKKSFHIPQPNLFLWSFVLSMVNHCEITIWRNVFSCFFHFCIGFS